LEPISEFFIEHRVGQGLTTRSPLRTVRDSFPSYSSSPSKAGISRPD